LDNYETCPAFCSSNLILKVQIASENAKKWVYSENKKCKKKRLKKCPLYNCDWKRLNNNNNKGKE